MKLLTKLKIENIPIIMHNGIYYRLVTEGIDYIHLPDAPFLKIKRDGMYSIYRNMFTILTYAIRNGVQNILYDYYK